MSAAPSWPLICATPAVRANLPNARLPPPSGLNFSNRPDRPKPDFGDFVPISFFGPSKRKPTRAARYRTRPLQPFISRTAKSPKSDRLPTACAGNPAAPVTAPCFPAAVPIWGGERGNSRAKPSNPHTFLCTPCSGTPRSTLLARSRGTRPRTYHLLEVDLRTSLLELGLDLVGLVLVDAFLDRLRSAFDEVLGFLQAETGDGADFLDDLDLLVAGSGKHDREFGLLFSGSCGSATSGGAGNRN